MPDGRIGGAPRPLVDGDIKIEVTVEKNEPWSDSLSTAQSTIRDLIRLRTLKDAKPEISVESTYVTGGEERISSFLVNLKMSEPPMTLLVEIAEYIEGNFPVVDRETKVRV